MNTPDTERPKCGRLLTPAFTLCWGALDEWRGTDGHGGTEWFTTCQKCGATR